MVVLTRSQLKQKNIEREQSFSPSEKNATRGLGNGHQHYSHLNHDSKASAPAVTKRRSVYDLLVEENNDLRGTERLGRGCRVHREMRSLDEEYLRSSFGGGGGGSDASTRHDDALKESFVINRRYPERESTKNQVLASFDTSSEDDNSDDASARSNAVNGGEYNFRHHPELADGIQQRSPSEGQDSESSSDSSETSSGGRGKNEPILSRRPGDRPRTGVQPSPGISARPAYAHVEHTNKSDAHKRRRGSDIDSSISNGSLREENIEKLAQEDMRAGNLSKSPEDFADDFSSDSTEPEALVTEKEMRRALRHAKESTEKNFRINHYMADAIGKPDAHRARRRVLDRRYRHLFTLSEEEKERGGGVGSSGAVASGGLGDISPLRVDMSLSFDSVGGLPEHIVALREMVLLPLLYPELLQRLGVSPPRGVLFVGPPGTGKTLMARALAAEGSNLSGHKITFFMRKGADILSKWVGESERQLGLLFEEARRQQPSIIFFDEIDGLAPTRHTKTEQTQAALVATLLALLDGLEDRGRVVVIGATNRPDTLDPALRRPGRFDRELLFPLPDVTARRHILSILTAKQQIEPSREAVLDELAVHTVGYSGADLKALCTEASLNRLRVGLPQLYLTSKRLKLPSVESLSVLRRSDFLAASQRLQPSLQRGSGAKSKSDLTQEVHLEQLFHGVREAMLRDISRIYPSVEQTLVRQRRDCADLGRTVRDMSSFPIPYRRHALLILMDVASRTDRDRNSFSRDDSAVWGPHFAENTDGGDASGLYSVHCANMDGQGLHHYSSLLPPSVFSLPAQPNDGASLGKLDDAKSVEPLSADKSSTVSEQMTLLNTAVAVMRALPTFRTLTVHMLHLRVGFFELPREPDGLPEGSTMNHLNPSSTLFMGGHFCLLVKAIRECGSPCLVLLCEMEQWLRDQGFSLSFTHTLEEHEVRERMHRMEALRYYLNLLADAEVIVLVPCASASTRHALLGLDSAFQTDESKEDRERLLSSAANHEPVYTRAITNGSLHPALQVLRVTVQPTPPAGEVRRFVTHLYRVIALTLRVQTAAPPATLTLEEDPLPSPRMAVTQAREKAAQRQALQRWRRVEYRRLQLRHILLKWLAQYVNSGRFKIFMSPDLDLDPSHPLYANWRRHTRHDGIGLQDLLTRLEAGVYVCLSQYHDDMDRLVHNVRSFFRSRSQVDQKYRLKALELKETTVLNLYKINQNLVRFCETHRDVTEPPALSDDESDGNGSSHHRGSSRLASESSGLRSEPPLPSVGGRPGGDPRRAHRRLRIFGQRRRRRRRRCCGNSGGREAVAQEARTGGGEAIAAGDAGPPESEQADASANREKTEEEKEGVSLPLDPPLTAEVVAQGAISVESSPCKQERTADPAIVAVVTEDEMQSPTRPAHRSVEPAAVALLLGLSYAEIDAVFWGVMRQLWLSRAVGEAKSALTVRDGLSSTQLNDVNNGGPLGWGNESVKGLVEPLQRARTLQETSTAAMPPSCSNPSYKSCGSGFNASLDHFKGARGVGCSDASGLMNVGTTAFADGRGADADEVDKFFLYSLRMAVAQLREGMCE